MLKVLFCLIMTVAINCFAFSSVENMNLNGTARVGDCSGALIRFPGQPSDTKAFVMSSANCLGSPYLSPGETIHNKKIRVRMEVADKNNKFHQVTVSSLAYATMTNTNIAIYHLYTTYDELEMMGIFPFELAQERPKKSQPIQILSGYWEVSFVCEIDGFVFKLREDMWSYEDVIRYSAKGCEMASGTSGSPILIKGTRRIIGLDSTFNWDGENCTLDNPCEQDEQGNINSVKDRGYGQQTHYLHKCITSSYYFDVNRHGCELIY